MKVCMILEGCYPFVRGGVSTWAHQYMTRSPEIEFVLWTVHAAREDTRKRLYELPANVKEHHMVILEEAETALKGHGRDRGWECQASEAIYGLVSDGEDSLEELTGLLRNAKESPERLLRSGAFLEAAERLSDEVPGLGLADAFYSLRSMMLPVCAVLSSKIPEADLYHSAVAGYGGLMGAMAARETGKPFVLTEHGIYPREREEELISADWTVPAMRPLWIRLFYRMSAFAYRHAARVTSLFEDAEARQVAIGCGKARCVVIPNGIEAEKFERLTCPESETEIHIGAFVRFAAIKDLKTLIHAFHLAREKKEGLVLHIMGDTDDPEYRLSCEALIERLKLGDHVRVEGHVDPLEYMKIMHFTVLSSISEGQPLTILESMAAGRPCVATRVGNCAGLLEGDMAGIGPAGICCRPMAPEEMADAILLLAGNGVLRAEMGANGRKRVRRKYLLEGMLRAYHGVYGEVTGNGWDRV